MKREPSLPDAATLGLIIFTIIVLVAIFAERAG